MQSIIQFEAKFPIKIKKQKRWVIASCPILDIHSQGENIKKAKENLTEAIFLFFVSCYERNTLDQALRECGFLSIDFHYPPKRLVGKKSKEQIKVPLPFLFDERKREELCHA